MNTVEFLRRILPATGLYVIARLTGKGWRHQVCDTIDEAAAYALQFDAQGVPTYHACAAYREREVETLKPNGEVWRQVRVGKNVRALRSFFMDLDVDPANEKKFPSQTAAIDGLVDFCTATALPIPMVVSSGGGVHIYWSLTDEVQPEIWRSTAEALKQLSITHGLKADRACSSDMARVLRPIGTFNRKSSEAGGPRPVELIADSASVGASEFCGMVAAALKRAGIKQIEAVRKVEGPNEAINQAFAVQHDFPPCSGVRVAERCQQLRVMRDTRGNIPEPHWYAGIQLLCHSIEGDELIHQWSNGYAGYSQLETDKKIAQIRSQNLGPSLCTTFESRNPGGCTGCQFQGKISSPAQLGTIVTSAPAPTVAVEINEQIVEVTLPLPPPPFTRGEKGGIYLDEEGITHKIYEYDCYPTELAYDENLGYETTRWRHSLPQEGWKECVIRSSLLASPKDFEAALRDQHIQPLIRNRMAQYGDAYIRKLRTDTKMRRLFKAQGWKNNDTEFVLGDKLYRANEIIQAGYSHGARGFLEHFQSKGSLAHWRAMTTIFQQPGLEPHAFALLTAFAAPLLKLDQRQGFTVSMLGETGAGKSTMGKFLASVYGSEHTWIMRGSTANARAERIGAYHSLPAYCDEVTTLAPKETRELVYLIATGRHRESLKQDRTVRDGAEWATIFIVSTNDSLAAKLQLEKQNAEAEGQRLFEFRFPRAPAFEEVASVLHQGLNENYGVAGPEYIKHIIANRDRIKGEVHRAIEDTAVAFGMQPHERFWSQAAALALYGGKLAVECGVIDFDPERIRPWLLKETRLMRKNLEEGHLSAVQVLALYLDEHIGERLVVTNLNAGMTAQNARPFREISSRYERDVQTLWISRAHLKRWLDERHYNYAEIRDELLFNHILLAADTKKVLGGGTDYTGGQAVCWKIKVDHPELSLVVGV